MQKKMADRHVINAYLVASGSNRIIQTCHNNFNAAVPISEVSTIQTQNRKRISNMETGRSLTPAMDDLFAAYRSPTISPKKAANQTSNDSSTDGKLLGSSQDMESIGKTYDQYSVLLKQSVLVGYHSHRQNPSKRPGRSQSLLT
jgi:hypothetical protein